jgi:putative addiction module killer protein
MVEVRQTDIFSTWLDGLRDLRARARVQARIERVASGNAGDVRPVGEGVWEMRIDYGPGYRVYFGTAQSALVLLWGGTKGSQTVDIRLARRLARNLQE